MTQRLIFTAHTNMDNRTTQLRNKLGQTAIPNTSGLSRPNDDMARLYGRGNEKGNIVERIQNATAPSMLNGTMAEQRIRKSIDDYRAEVKHLRKLGAIPDGHKVNIYAFDMYGDLVKEEI